MGRYIFRRAAASVLLLWIVLTVTFLALHAAPGDPILRFQDPRIPATQLDHIRSLYGLDQSLTHQYAVWLRAAIRGDWGVSFLYQLPARTLILQRLGPTLLLGLSAFAVQVLVGFALGLIAARRPGSLADHASRVSALGLYSVPTFWLAVMLVLFGAGVLHLFPSHGMSTPFSDEWRAPARFLDLLRHLVMPAIALGLPLAAPVARLLRNSLLEELGRDYVTGARSRGLPEWRVLWQALRNALRPLIQIAGWTLPALLGGSVVVETVFGWPGLGSAAFYALEARDYPLALAVTAFSGCLVVAGNLMADVLSVLADPRLVET